MAVNTTAASSNGTAVTSSGTANTKGAWTQLTASTVSAGQLMIIAQFPTNSQSLLDIGVGAAASETVLIPNIHHSLNPANTPASFMFPVIVPAGNRLSARLASSTASAVVNLNAYLIAGGFDIPVGRSLVRAYGADTSDSGGTSVDPGATIHTKGAWTQLTASTTEAIKALMIVVGNRNNAANTAANFLVDVGVGAAASETVLIPDYRLMANVINIVEPRVSPAFPVSIPAASRLAVRSQSGTADATDRLLDFVLYGVT